MWKTCGKSTNFEENCHLSVLSTDVHRQLHFVAVEKWINNCQIL
jgi:hypothetical protein